MQTGYIYVLKNQYMQGLLKIGFTTRKPDDRVKELSGHTGVPGKFSLVRSWEVDDPAAIEKSVFSTLRSYRAEGEFFAISVEEAQSKIVETLQRLGQADSNGVTIPQKTRELLRQQEIDKQKARQDQIDNCKRSWVANLRNTRLIAAKATDKKIGYSYTQLDELIKKCELPDAVTTPAFFLTLGLSLILESKLQDKKGRQKWVDLQYKWVQSFEDEMANQKDKWWEQNDGEKSTVQGSIEWWSFYQDTKWLFTPRN